ncbi:hypothetical protein Moror_5855 [Moniliophthora roreri MCA 2997]|uniref:Uncharacterized protein n=1 Tax=Moniliophthora roreri (strain MCA 2997) TaxID=1381753 RepID=V2Y6A4_MONRO|nr:hypothetical protein Moror_5855 [Moniliophthora roreri MCA 2997]
MIRKMTFFSSDETKKAQLMQAAWCRDCAAILFAMPQETTVCGSCIAINSGPLQPTISMATPAPALDSLLTAAKHAA